MDKLKYKKIYKKNKKRRLFHLLFIFSLVSFVIGIFYVAVITKSDRNLIKTSFDQFFLAIKNNHLDMIKSLLNGLKTNVFLPFVVWVLGISIIGVPVSIFFLLFKSFILGFTIGSIIYTYGLKGILIAFIYSIPLVINLLVIFILMFYAINFSKELYLHIFKKKESNLSILMKVYFKVLLISILILFISCFISSYFIPFFINVFTNSLI